MSIINRLRTLATNKIYELPIVVLMPHSSCNCRCVMCDIWKANNLKQELSVEDLEKHAEQFSKLKVREVVLSGGEALMHSNFWTLCSLLTTKNIKLTLLTTGLLLERNANNVVQYIDEVIVSIDGSKATHDQIRNIPNGYDKIAAGIKAIRKLNPDFLITARSVIQRHNFRDFIQTVNEAKSIGVNRISFLAADVSTSAFNHDAGLTKDRKSEIALTLSEAQELEQIIKNSWTVLRAEYESKFIAESPQKILSLAHYYKAINGTGEYPPRVCNAPWVSAVIESDGRVMPCFFHKPYGNIYESDFLNILNSNDAIRFRKNLNIKRDETCKKCVCTLNLGITH